MYIPGNMSGKNEWKWPYSLWTIELKPTQLWQPQKSTFCDRSVWRRHGEKYHPPAMASHWDESSGATVSHIAQTMQMSQRTVYSILRRRRENPGDVKDWPRSGRRRATTGREDRALVRLARQQRYATSSTRNEMDPRVHSLDELREAIHEVWRHMPQQYVRRLIHSMRRRVAAVIAADGGSTHYRLLQCYLC